MEMLLRELLIVAAFLGGYEAPTGGLPEVNFVTKSQLQTMYECNHSLQQSSHEALGLYDRSSKVIYLSHEFDSQSTAERAMLLHEIVHYLQDLNGAYETKWKHACGQPDEAEAYKIEAMYLEKKGASRDTVESVRMQGKLFGLCSPAYIIRSGPGQDDSGDASLRNCTN